MITVLYMTASLVMSMPWANLELHEAPQTHAPLDIHETYVPLRSK